MRNYIIRRLLYLIPTILSVALLVFLLFTVVGDDPVRVALGKYATPETIADLQAKWGLDQPLWKQFLDFLRQIVTFDYGESFVTGDTLSESFSQGAWVSLSLTLPPLILGLLINVPLAMGVAYYRDTWFDRSATALAVMAMSVSYLVYILAFQYFLAFKFDWFPINGYEASEPIRYLALPWLIAIIVAIGPDIRIYRTIFLNEIQANYVRTARAKGLSEKRVLFVHLLKNAMIPILTFTIVAVPFLILGAFVMERFFSIPGLGNLLITAINNGDQPVLKGLTMYITIAYSLFNLLTDVLIAYVDPRVKLR
ncbi:MAG: ABC transporter permease [Thermosynechococcaceae cyanobacterium]